MEIVFLRQAYKFIRKADKPFREKIKAEILHIGDNRKIGKLLNGELKKLRSHKFIHQTTNYRIAYAIRDNLIIILIATRENFYMDLMN